MSWDNIQVDDFGWIGKLTLVDKDANPVDLSTYNDPVYILLNPDGVSKIKTVVFDSDGLDGKLKYTIVDGDIDIVGLWGVAARIVKAGVELTSEPLPFRVVDRID